MYARQAPSGIPEHLLLELESQKNQINKIKQQRDTLQDLQENFKKKDKEITRLLSLVDKYKSYYEKYSEIKVELAEKVSILERKEKQNKILMKQVDDMLKDSEENRKKIKNSEIQRHQLIKQRHQIENFNKQIETTFKEYQTECKNKEKQLLYDLEKAYLQIKDLNARINHFEIMQFDNEQLRMKLNENEQRNASLSKANKRKQSGDDTQKINKLKQQNERLKRQLRQKEQELQRSKLLNHELSVQFDKSVSKICEFERELSEYRRQNHQLKKTMRLFLQNEQCDKQYQKNLKKQQELQSQEQQIKEDDESLQQESSNQGGYQEEQEGQSGSMSSMHF